jgi:hypothetical protein
MRRWLKRIAIGLIGLLALAAGAGWIASQWRTDIWSYRGRFNFTCQLGDGRIAIMWERKVLSRIRVGESYIRPDRSIDLAAFLDDRSERLEWQGPSGWTHHQQRSSFGAFEVPLLDAHLDVRRGWCGSQMGDPRDQAEHTFDQTRASLPLLAIALIAAVIPVATMLGALGRRRVPAGRCQACGYDLRESPTRCPECGRAVSVSDAVRVRSWESAVVAVAVTVLILVLLAAADALLGSGPRKGFIAGGIVLIQPSVPEESPAPRRVPEFAIWLQQGSIFLAETHARTSHVFLWPPHLADASSPRLTGQAWLEPSFRTVSDNRGRGVHVLSLPLWIVVIFLAGGLLLWFRRVRRRGGFYLGLLKPDPPSPDAPAAP